eukprot:jgi/Chrzof1/13929/Cz08g18070.t1
MSAGLLTKHRYKLYTLPINSRPCACHGVLSTSRYYSTVRCSSHANHDNYYQTLNVEPEATDEQIKAAFRKKARQLHPDVNKESSAALQFMQLKRAYDVLSQSMLRAEHDSSLGLASARAKDPRFARFERWRTEVVPDLRMQLEVWSKEMDDILLYYDGQLNSIQAHLQEQTHALQMLQTTETSDPNCVATPNNHQSAAHNNTAVHAHECTYDDVCITLVAMRNSIDECSAVINRQFQKRYEQVEVRYPAYPDIVWYDVWEQTSAQWLQSAQSTNDVWTSRCEQWQLLVDAMGLQQSQVTMTSR